MDKKSALRNIVASIVFKVILMILNIFLLKSLDYIGETYTGYHSLFHSIIAVVNLSESGFAGGVAFCLYGAIVKNDENKIIALYSFLRKCYRIIFVVVAVLGLSVTPVLPFLDKDIAAGSSFGVFVYLSYVFYIISTALTYLFSYKSTIICAYKNNYKKDITMSIGLMVQYALQIVVAYVFKNFFIFAICTLVGTIIQFVLITLVFKKDHKLLLNKSLEIDKQEKKRVLKYVFSSFVHHVGDVLVYSTDSIIISSMIGAVTLAGYYRYLSIANAIFTISSLLFTSLTSVVGHSFESNSKEQMLGLFKKSYFIGFLVGTILYLGFYGGSDFFIGFAYGTDKIIEFYIPMCMAFCFFVRFMQKPCLLFRDASGAFSKDWYKPIIECVINLTLDFILVKYLGVVGVVLATIIVLLFVSHVLEPINLFVYSFKKNPIKYLLTNYCFIGVFAIEIGIVWLLRRANTIISYDFIGFIIFGTVSVLIAFAFSILADLVLRTGFTKMALSKIGLYSRPDPKRIAKRCLFSSLFILILVSAALVSTGLLDYKLDRFSFSLVDYTRINYSNNAHPVIMNVSSEQEKGKNEVYLRAFKYFHYNLIDEAARIVVDNATSISIGDEVVDIKMLTQPTFSIGNELPNDAGYYLDYGQYTTYYKDELLVSNNQVRGDADIFIFISDKLADLLLEQYNLSSYDELILNPTLSNLSIDIDGNYSKVGCINNILYSNTRNANKTIAVYGEYFVLFYNNAATRNIINLSFEIELKTNPYSNKKCFRTLRKMGYNTNNSDISFLKYDDENDCYLTKDNPTSIKLSEKFKKIYSNTTDWFYYVLYTLVVILFIPYYFLERNIFGERGSSIIKRLIILVLFSICYSLFAAIFYSYVYWGASILISIILFVIINGKELLDSYNERKNKIFYPFIEVKI